MVDDGIFTGQTAELLIRRNVSIMDQRTPSCLHRHTPVVVSLIVLLVAGFFSKFYDGPAREWANDSLAGVFYVVFWCVLASFVLPRVTPAAVAVGVLVVTCFLECLQLWHPPVLESLRGTFLGRALIGTSFAWSDFPYYAVGSVIGWWWVVRLRRMCKPLR